MRLFELKNVHVIFTVNIPKKDETPLWFVDDGSFIYHHFFQFGIATPSDGTDMPMKFALQLVAGPVLFSLAFAW